VGNHTDFATAFAATFLAALRATMLRYVFLRGFKKGESRQGCETRREACDALGAAAVECVYGLPSCSWGGQRGRKNTPHKGSQGSELNLHLVGHQAKVEGLPEGPELKLVLCDVQYAATPRLLRSAHRVSCEHPPAEDVD
jgi:hypothetical protein